MFFALKEYVSSFSLLTSTPKKESNSISLLTSLIFGIFSITTSSSVKSTAQITCKASFLAPCGTISPLRVLPPIISNLLIDYLLMIPIKFTITIRTISVLNIFLILILICRFLLLMIENILCGVELKVFVQFELTFGKFFKMF